MSDKLPCCGNDKIILVDISDHFERKIECSECGTQYYQNKTTGELTKIGKKKRLAMWQPIETAPKDGTDILVCVGTRQYVVSWEHVDRDKLDEGWWHVDDNKHGPFPLRGKSPTHWMPLPKHPGGIVDETPS